MSEKDSERTSPEEAVKKIGLGGAVAGAVVGGVVGGIAGALIGTAAAEAIFIKLQGPDPWEPPPEPTKPKPDKD